MEEQYDVSGFPQRLKGLLESKNVSGYELAAAIQVQKQTIYKWLDEEINIKPNADALLRTADYLNVDPYWLLYGREGESEFIKFKKETEQKISEFVTSCETYASHILLELGKLQK